MATNVPTPEFTDVGFVAPTEDEILAGTLADINEAFGGNLNVQNLETPQGQIASSEAAIIANAYDLFCMLTQQMDPAYAKGRMQDAIARIYFLTRNPALPTTVDAVCSGQGATIPAGAQAIDDSGNIYVAVDGGILPADGGSITLQFACTVTGPIPCAAGTLNRIYQQIPGWDSITNPTDGVLGQDVETRAAFEDRRVASVAKNGRGIIQSVLGEVLATENVIDAYAIQNDSGVAITVRGVTLAPHSIYVAAVGGSDQDIGEAIWRKKSPGCGYTGNTEVTVVDDSFPYTAPYPEYEVKFERPAETAVPFRVVLAGGPLVPSTAIDQVKAAIIAAFAGEDGGPRARIGSTIFASRFVCPVAALGSWVQIISLQVGSPLGNSVTLDIDEVPVTSPSDIDVVIS